MPAFEDACRPVLPLVEQLRAFVDLSCLACRHQRCRFFHFRFDSSCLRFPTPCGPPWVLQPIFDRWSGSAGRSRLDIFSGWSRRALGAPRPAFSRRAMSRACGRKVIRGMGWLGRRRAHATRTPLAGTTDADVTVRHLGGDRRRRRVRDQYIETSNLPRISEQTAHISGDDALFVWPPVVTWSAEQRIPHAIRPT